MTGEQREKITKLLNANKFGVIATIGDRPSPESAVITIAAVEDLSIIFGSFKGFRKNQNITRNPHVSFVVGWDPVEKQTLQIEGEAVLIPETELEAGYKRDPERDYFRIIPRWIKYSDFGVTPREVWEVQL